MSSIPRTGIVAIIAVALILITSALLITPASASTASIIIDERLHQPWFDTSGSDRQTSSDSWAAGNEEMRNLGFKNIENHQILSYIVIDSPKSLGQWDNGSWMAEGRYDLTYIYDGITKPAVVYISRPITGGTKITIFLNDWDIGNKKGSQIVTLPGWRFTSDLNSRDGKYYPPIYMVGNTMDIDATITWVSAKEWYTDVFVSEDIGYDIRVNRTVYGVPYETNVTILGPSGLLDSEKSVGDVTEWWYPKTGGPYTLKINSPAGTATEYRLGAEDPALPGDPATASVTIYVKNSQTAALLANAQININEYGTETWYNTTAEWGWTTVELPAGNYEFYAEYDGFTQVAPGRLTVNEADENIVILLHPDSPPAPTGNITLQIWANYGELGDGRRYGVPGAEITVTGLAGEGMSFSSGNLTANNDGFVTVTAPGNSTYSIYASRVGYLSGESRVTVSTASPVKVSVGLTPGTLPTSPPLTPTIQPTTPKPTQTTPPGSFIDTSAGGLANLFGTTLETGRTLLGFLVALAVGMGTAKQLRGGAPEFVVGFLGASFLGLVAGLIPVGFFVLIALLCGVYLGKTYIGGGDNGR